MFYRIATNYITFEIEVKPIALYLSLYMIPYSKYSIPIGKKFRLSHIVDGHYLQLVIVLLLMIKKQEAYIYLSYFCGIGPVTHQHLLGEFGTGQETVEANEKELQAMLGPIGGPKFYRFIHTFDAKKEYKRLTKEKIFIYSYEDISYPQALKNIPDPPICLYVRGDMANIDLNKGLYFAIVGTRNPTGYGRLVARQLSQTLSKSGMTIVSGMAKGVDGIAHEAAMERGKTIAVLGCGVDVVYPKENRVLYEKIVGGGGLVVSEFPPGRRVQKGLFIARNRLISGLCRGVLVVEGAKHSGTLVTARFAAEQGRDVFAVPSPITSPVGFAPNFLIKEGATLVTSPDDILKEYL